MGAMSDPSILRFRRAVAAACAELESRRQEVNDLNVFPVADGDTGDNMAMTLRAVLDELDRINGQPIDDIGRDELVAAVARAALLGARGNSGVILSQIVRGAAEELASRPGELGHHTAPVGALHHAHGHESGRFRYCTNFAVTGDGLEASRFVAQLEEIGDSVLVVGDRKTLKVHVHTDEPDRAVALFEGGGSVSRLDVADMREQVADRDERLRDGGPPERELAECGVVAVVNGAGIASLYVGLGANVVDGGPTLNPSTYDLLAGVHAAAARGVVLLPNSANVILAAERAAELSEKPVCVVPTRSQQAAIPALLSFDPDASPEENAAAIALELESVRTGGVAKAARADPGGRFEPGDALGYVGEDLVAWGEPEPTLRAVMEQVGRGAEVITCIAGADAPLGRDAVERSLPDGADLDFHAGGQPAWWWLLVAE